MILTAAITISGSVYAQQIFNFDVIGYIQIVDPTHDKITISHNTTVYIVDTHHAVIHFPALASTPGETGDLISGMRVEVSGIKVSGPIVKAVRVQVLPYVPPGTIPPVVLVTVSQSPALAPARINPSIKLFGTMDSVDVTSSVVVLRVDNQTRVVHVGAQSKIADTSGAKLSVSDLAIGDTLQVAAKLGADGIAEALSITRQQSAEPSTPIAAPTIAQQVLTGVVTEEATVFSRDIKISTADGDTKIDVPRGVDIEIDGKQSSVHDLKKNLTVQVYGSTLPNNTFQADRIISTTSYVAGE